MIVLIGKSRGTKGQSKIFLHELKAFSMMKYYNCHFFFRFREI